MTISPTWQPAIPGTPGGAGCVNQFLAGHEATVSYGGALQSASDPGSSAYTSTQSVWLSQNIRTGISQTTIGYLQLQVSDIGGSAVADEIPPLTVDLYAEAFGAPSGALLASATIGSQYVYSEPFWVTVPLTATGLTSSTDYQIVTRPAGDATRRYVWQRSTAAGGASTSPDGTTWTAAAYGLMYRVFDQSGGASSMPLLIIEDGGARATKLAYAADGELASIFTSTSGPAGTVSYSASLAYTDGLITGVS